MIEYFLILYACDLKIWFLRISMFFKLKLFKEAEIELKQFENFEYSYEYLNDVFPNRKGKLSVS